MPTVRVPELDLDGDAAYSPTLRRKLLNTLQKSIGKQPMRYQVEVIPTYVGMSIDSWSIRMLPRLTSTIPRSVHAAGLPAGIEAVCVVMERRGKFCSSETSPVDKISHTARFRSAMKQVLHLFCTATCAKQAR
jgi:hypothetical protein